jgi:hypothetical protein
MSKNSNSGKKKKEEELHPKLHRFLLTLTFLFLHILTGNGLFDYDVTVKGKTTRNTLEQDQKFALLF